MNSDVNCSNVGNKNKNSKILVERKEPSLPSQCNPCPSKSAKNSEFGNETSEKTDQGLSTLVKKQTCRILTEKGPQIHNSNKISHLKKYRAEKIEKAEIEPVKETEEKEKLSRDLVSNKKSNNSASYKQRSTLNNKRDISNNGFNGHVHKKVTREASGEKSFPKAKETCCKSIQSMAKSIVDRETRKKTEAATIEKKRETSCMKKYSIKANIKDKIELDDKRTDDGIDGSKKSIQNRKVSTLQTVDGKKSMPEKTTCDHNASKKNNGAARTRIFHHKRRSLVNKNLTGFRDNECKKNTDSFKGKLDNVKPTLEKEDRKRHEIETNDSMIKNLNADPVDFSCSTQGQNIVSLFQRSPATPESSSDSNQFQKFEKNYTRSTADGVNNNSTSDAGIGTSCETALQKDIDIDLSRGKVKKKYGKEWIESSVNVVNHDQTEIIKSKTSVFRDDVIHYSNLINYGYHSDQQHSKRDSGNRDEKYTADAVIKSIEAEEKKNTSDNDSKYNLMKALIHPASEIHNLKGTEKNFSKLSEPRKSSENVLDCRDEGLQNYCINYLSNNGSLDNVTPSLSNNFQRLQNDIKSTNSSDSLISHPSLTHFNELWRSNIADDDDDNDDDDDDDDTINSKMQGCNHTKRYRHFKYEEKKMCCNMARYIEKMVSNERKHQEDLEEKINPEREEVKIIIDENSPKTSRISIVNDRSSISVVCHSSGRMVSQNERKNNATVKKAESSGGESSGYKSLHNSNTKDFDFSDQIEIKSMMGQACQHSDKSTSRYRYEVHFPPYNSFDSNKISEQTSRKGNVTSLRNSLNKLREENLESGQNASNKKCEKQISTEIKFTPSDTNKYLSTFTKCMDGYLPSEIAAYQLKEVHGNKLLQFDDDEILEKDTNDPELRIGNYLESENSDSEDESSEEEGSSEEFGFFKGNVRIEGEVIVLKSSDNLYDKSTEIVVDQRFMNPDHESEAQNDSTNIPSAPAQFKIISSLADMISIESTTESSSISPDISDVKLETNNVMKNVKPIPMNLPKTNHANTAVQPTAKAKHSCFRPAGRKICCLKKLKNERERLDDANAVHELWANKKSTADSTDNESQQSVKFRSGKNHANKYKFNMFKKLSTSSNEKTIQISLHQLPKPPPSFLESSVPSQSTVLSSTVDTETFESDDGFKPPVVDITSISPNNSAAKVRPDNPGGRQSIKAHMNASSNGEDNPLQFQPNDSTSVPNEQFDIQPGTSTTLPKNKNSFEEAQELHVAVPPPASAVPPPYPFCCPFVPYMMQHWQNNQQPPPASTVPLPEANWKSNIDMGSSSPPPPGMVPFPWFSQLAQRNNNTDGLNSANNLYAQPPPEWLMMPRGYAPCLPCSKTPEQHLKKADSSITEEDESIFETSENKQDEKKKTVSHKLFKIFRKKTKGEAETVDEDDKKGRYLRTRSDSKPMNRVQVDHKVKQSSDERNIWESPDIAGIVTPEEIGRCFRRGFRADGLTLSGDDYLCTRAPSDTASGQEDVFNFSEHDTPLDFLLALGFSVDEATAAIRDDEVRRRFKAALTEARIWVPHIATTQGTLLYLLAMKAKPKVMRYFLQLVESIVNKRITNAVKLDAYLKILEKVEDGYVSFVTLFGKDKGQEYEEDTVIVEKQRRRIFYTIYKYAESEAEEVARPLTKASVDLLHSLAARYRSAIGPHLRLLACYIGEGLLTKDVQLEAALIYLSRLDSADVRLEDLEKYCGLPPSERRRQEKAAEIKSSSDKV